MQLLLLGNEISKLRRERAEWQAMRKNNDAAVSLVECYSLTKG